VDDDIEQLLDLGLEFEGLRAEVGMGVLKGDGQPIPIPQKINAAPKGPGSP
jgi:hypothetical protein